MAAKTQRASSKKSATRRPTRPAGKKPPARSAGSVASQARRPTVKDSAFRTWVVDHSKAPVVILSRQPKFLMPIIMVALVLTGLAAPVPLAVVALIILAIFIGWLAFLSWPVLDTRGRTMRLLVAVVLVGVAVARISGLLD